MAKKKINRQLLVTGIIVVILGILVYGISHRKTDTFELNIKTAKPSPANTTPIFSNIDKNLTKIALPEYKISFQIESQYLIPNYFQTDNTSTRFYITSPDATSRPNGQRISGAEGEIDVFKNWNGFPNIQSENWKNFVIDNSFLPNNNPLVNQQTARGYTQTYPSFEAKNSPTVESRRIVKLDTQSLIGYNGGFLIWCVDLSGNRCLEIENAVLNSLRIEK